MVSGPTRQVGPEQSGQSLTYHPPGSAQGPSSPPAADGPSSHSDFSLPTHGRLAGLLSLCLSQAGDDRREKGIHASII